jgi:hypothetical protein
MLTGKVRIKTVGDGRYSGTTAVIDSGGQEYHILFSCRQRLKDKLVEGTIVQFEHHSEPMSQMVVGDSILFHDDWVRWTLPDFEEETPIQILLDDGTVIDGRGGRHYPCSDRLEIWEGIVYADCDLCDKNGMLPDDAVEGWRLLGKRRND